MEEEQQELHDANELMDSDPDEEEEPEQDTEAQEISLMLGEVEEELCLSGQESKGSTQP